MLWYKKLVDENVLRFRGYYRQGSPGECWPWSGPLNRTGTPQIFWNGRTTGAARVAYMLVHGDIPRGRRVQRGCVEPTCVNPGHLIVTPVAPAPPDTLTGCPKKGYVRVCLYTPPAFAKNLREEAQARDKPMGEIVGEAFASRITFIRKGETP